MKSIDLVKKVKDVGLQLNTMGIDFDVKYPRLSTETNDYDRFMRAYNDLEEGQTLLLSNKIYDFKENTIILNKNVNIKGSKKTLL